MCQHTPDTSGLLTCLVLVFPILHFFFFFLKHADVTDCFHLLTHIRLWPLIVITPEPLSILCRPDQSQSQFGASAGTQQKHIQIRRVVASLRLLWENKMCFRSSVRIWWAGFTKTCAKDLNLSSNTRFQSRDKGSAMVVHDWFKTLHNNFAVVDRHTWASHSFHVNAAPSDGCCPLQMWRTCISET